MSTTAPLDLANRRRAPRQWFAFLGGGLAWTAHLLSIYAIGEFGCTSGFGRVQWAGISAVAWSLIAVSAPLLAVAIAAGVVGYRDAGGWNVETPADGGTYLSRFGAILDPIFSLIIAVESIPIFFYLDGC